MKKMTLKGQAHQHPYRTRCITTTCVSSTALGDVRGGVKILIVDAHVVSDRDSGS